jgi:hypothetical protein
MFERDVSNSAEPKRSVPGEHSERPTNAPYALNPLSSPNDPFSNGIDRTAVGLGAQGHGSAIGRLYGSGRTRAAGSLLNLQQRCGNRSVQRLLAISEKEGIGLDSPSGGRLDGVSRLQAGTGTKTVPGRVNIQAPSPERRPRSPNVQRSMLIRREVASDGPQLEITDQHRQWAANYIGYWYSAAREAVDELPTGESALSVLLVQAGTLLWSLSPLLATTPLGLALVGTAGAQLALLGATSGIRRNRETAIKQDIIANLGLVETSLQRKKEDRSDFDPKVRSNLAVYDNVRLAIWHTIFPNMGFQNRTQIKQTTKASALRQMYESGSVPEMAAAGREGVIAAIGVALIEHERWQRSWGDRRPSHADIARHFNATYRTARRQIDPTAGRAGPLLGFGYGAFEVLGTDSQGRLMVNSSFRSFFAEAIQIYGRRIRVAE